MSYNLQGNRISNRDRDRERPRQGFSKPPIRDRDRGDRDRAIRPPASVFGHPEESYRRQEQRDYFGYRGNYRKPSYSGNRKRESYDKYRPGSKNKNQRSWNDKRKPSSGDRLRERSEYKPEERRPSHEGKERNEQKTHSPQDHTESSSHRHSEPAPSEPVPRAQKDVPGLTSDTKVHQLLKQLRVPEIKDEKLLHLFDDDVKEEPKEDQKEKQLERPQEGSSARRDSMDKKESPDKKEFPDRKESLDKREFLEKRESLDKKESLVKKDSLDKKESFDEKEFQDKEPLDKKEPLEVSAPKVDSKRSAYEPKVAEDKPLLDNNDGGEESEAETVITNEPISTDVAKLLLRNRGVDEERRRLKRKIVYSDESDESDEGDGTHEKDDDDSYRPSSSQRPTEERTNTLDKKTTPSLSYSAHSRRASLESNRLEGRSGADSSDESDREKAQRRQQYRQETKPSSSYKMKRDSTGRSLLQRACKKGDIEAVKNLIARGADANESDFGGFTCLHEAALAGNTEIVEFLIKKGADVNKQALEAGDSETPLMDASENRHVDTVRVLLENGADPNITNVDGFSALTKLYHLQTEEDNYDEVISLLSAAADKTQTLKAFSKSPRKVIEDPNEGYFSDLTRKKSQLSAIYKYVAQNLKEAAAEDFILHGHSLQKKPDILILAARHGHTELVDILLGLNPGSFDINLKNKVGVSILLASVGRGNYDVVRFLLSRGADPLVTRQHDNLNALQIAKHSAQHDPREVFLLERHLAGETEKPTVAHPPSSPTPEGKGQSKTARVKDEVVEDHDRAALEANSLKTKSKPPVEQEATFKKRKNLEDFEAKSAKKRKEAVKDTINETKATGEDAKELEKKLMGSPLGDGKERSPEEQKGKIHRSASSTSLSPGPMTKAQEEQKQKALEEAKIWQEKVQAKKRARKEMFLQAEKEKERKRKEDEERRVELEKQEKLRAKEDEIRKAQEAEKLAKDLESRRKKLEADLILQKYPIGLRQFVFGLRMSGNERFKYSPLYVFDIEGGSFVIDLQISLLLAKPVGDLHERCYENAGDARVLDTEAKTKVWPLFFPMVGVGKNYQVESDGLAKFLGLQVSFLPYEAVAEYVKVSDADLHEKIWSTNKETRVNLALLPVVTNSNPTAPVDTRGPENGANPKTGFVPPKWKLRQDVIRTISSAHTPLW